MLEPAKLESLMKEGEAQLLRYAVRYLREPQDAKDAVQEAFLRYVKASRGETAIENPLAWLFKATRNVCLDLLKSKRRKLEISLDESFDAPQEGAEAPDGAASRRDEQGMLKRLVEELDGREREALSLKIEHGKSYKEIAETLELSVSNVGFILHNAIKKMRKAYRQLEEGAGTGE